MLTNELKKGAIVRLQNGWEAEIYDNMKGNTRLAKVYGYETEIGSVYSWDIAGTIARIGDGSPIIESVQLTDKQKADRQRCRAMFG